MENTSNTADLCVSGWPERGVCVADDGLYFECEEFQTHIQSFCLKKLSYGNTFL